jgi:adenosylcobinamide-phosphate synthase
VTAAATWAVLGGRSLTREASTIDGQLARDDLEAARVQVRNLVGRDTTRLDDDEVARACIESLAENTSDAVVAPLLAGAFGGLAGVAAYRAANTLDAMVGHHNDRYERFGWAAARFDDLVNLPGSRIGGAATLLASPGTARSAAKAWRRDAAAHPSPNAGVVEATFAGALGIRLGGTNRYYGSWLEHRSIMGDGRAVRPEDIGRAARLARRVGIIGAVVSASGALLVARRTAGRRAIASG